MVLTEMQAQGFPDKVVPYALAQLLFESNNFQSKQAKTAWNYGGVKLSKWAKDNLNAFDQGNGFAGYRNYKDFITDYKRVLAQAPGKPLLSVTADDYLRSLNANHYFGAYDPKTYNNYGAGLNAKLKIANQFLNDLHDPNAQITKDVAQGTANQKYFDNRNTVNPAGWWDRQTMPVKLGVAAGGTLVGLVVLKNLFGK